MCVVLCGVVWRGVTCSLALLYALVRCGLVGNDVHDAYGWSVEVCDDICRLVAVQLHRVQPHCLRRAVHLLSAAVHEHANKQRQRAR